MFFASLAFAASILQTLSPQSMSGAWSVDLTANPDEPYFKPMHLALQPDGQVTGDFYESEIQAGRWKAQGGRLCVSFRTTDGAEPYHTTGCMVGDEIQGQTWAEHRDFVFIWSAQRAAA